MLVGELHQPRCRRAALNEAMHKLVSHPSFCKLVLIKFFKQVLPKMPVLSLEQQASKLREILQRKKWTIYQLASLQSHLEAHRSIMVEKISLASQETAEFNSDNTADDIYAAIEAFIAVVSRIVVGDQAPLDL